MSPDELVAAFALPQAARVDRRVPKSLLTQHAAPTAADKRRIQDGIEELRWVAALKPTTIGVPAFRDGSREYVEIAVLRAELRGSANGPRLVELVHRAVPYPVVLIAGLGEGFALSLAHKRWSLLEAGATVLDGDVLAAPFTIGTRESTDATFLRALALSRQPHGDLFELYRSWAALVLALLAARLTGTFTPSASPEGAERRRDALADCARLDGEIARLRRAAAREPQLAKQVALNLELKRVEKERVAAERRLG